MALPALLCVDDDPDVLRAVARDLRRHYGARYRVLRADSGAEALAAVHELRARAEPLALVLSDQRMPQMDGVGLLAAVREIEPRARRVLLTAYADTDAAIAAINASSVHHYLLKPWDPPEERLYPVLDDLLDDWQAGFRPGTGGLRVLSDRWNAAAHTLRDWLARNGVPYTFFDVERDADAAALAAGAALPLAVLTDGTRLESATPAAVAERLGLREAARAAYYDLAIVGGGPAGLAAAVYGASEGLSTVLVERDAPGGQAGTSSRIENYLGFPAGLSGGDLARRATAQARRFGVEILTPRTVCGLAVDGPYKELAFADGGTLRCGALMVATGVDWNRLPAGGADALTGRGVYYGAAMTEAMACQGERVATVGAGNSAGQAALYLAEYAARVTMLVRGKNLGATMSQYLVDRIEAHERIDVRLNTEVTACHGTANLEGLTVRDRATGTAEALETGSLFVFIGAAPDTAWLAPALSLDARGYVKAGPDLSADDLRGWPLERAPFLLEASVPGVFVAGDVRSESVKRVASAVGEGSVAVQFVHRHLASL